MRLARTFLSDRYGVVLVSHVHCVSTARNVFITLGTGNNVARWCVYVKCALLQNRWGLCALKWLQSTEMSCIPNATIHGVIYIYLFIRAYRWVFGIHIIRSNATIIIQQQINSQIKYSNAILLRFKSSVDGMQHEHMFIALGRWNYTCAAGFSLTIVPTIS